MLLVNGFHGINSAEAILFWHGLKYTWDVSDIDFFFCWVFFCQETISPNDLTRTRENILFAIFLGYIL